jgi:hypothetical protein
MENASWYIKFSKGCRKGLAEKVTCMQINEGVGRVNLG